MRLFYDEYTTRLRSAVFLLLADLLTIGAAILFASGACYRQSAEDAILIAIWAAIPRGVGRYLEWLQKPHRFTNAVLLAFCFVAFNGLLVWAGWDLLWKSAAAAERMEPHTLFCILLAWGSGYFLCFLRCYRVSDGLLAAVLLLGLLEKMPQPLVWVPVYLLGLCLSAATRHLVHNVFLDVRGAHFNLQNVRAVAYCGALLAALAYGGVFLGLYPLFDSPTEEELRIWEITPIRPRYLLGTV